MSYVYYNPNPKGLEMADMPSSNIVWGTYLMEKGLCVLAFLCR